MKTDEMQAAAGSAAAGSRSAHVWRPMGAAGATGRWSASVLQFGATGHWSASVLRWGRSAAVGSSTLNPSHSKWLRWDFGTVRVVLAAVLLVAAALKSEQLWSSSPQPFASPMFALIVFEFAFAAWLLTGWLPRATWWLAFGCFTAFALAASIKTLSGQNDCGCFGAVRLPPVAALLMDVAALALLLCFRPSHAQASIVSNALRAVLVVAVFSALVAHHFSRSEYDGRFPLRVVSSLDFGIVWKQQQFSWTIVIENTRDVPIEVAHLEASCDCAFIAPRRFVVPENGRREVSIRLDLTRGDRDAFSAVIRPVLADSSSAEWHIRGRVVQPPVSLSAASVDFGEVNALSATSYNVLITPHEPMAVTTFEFDRAVIQVACDRPEDDFAGPFSLAILPATTLAVGSFASELSMHVRFYSEPFRSLGECTLTLPIRGVHSCGMNWFPTHIILGIVEIGEVTQREVFVFSQSGSPVEVESLAICNTLGHLDMEVRAQFDAKTPFVVAFTPTTPGDAMTRLMMTVRANDHRALIQVPILAHVTPRRAGN